MQIIIHFDVNVQRDQHFDFTDDDNELYRWRSKDFSAVWVQGEEEEENKNNSESQVRVYFFDTVRKHAVPSPSTKDDLNALTT